VGPQHRWVRTLVGIGVTAVLAVGIAYGAGARAVPLASPAATSTPQGNSEPAPEVNGAGGPAVAATALVSTIDSMPGRTEVELAPGQEWRSPPADQVEQADTRMLPPGCSCCSVCWSCPQVNSQPDVEKAPSRCICWAPCWPCCLQMEAQPDVEKTPPRCTCCMPCWCCPLMGLQPEAGEALHRCISWAPCWYCPQMEPQPGAQRMPPGYPCWASCRCCPQMESQPEARKAPYRCICCIPCWPCLLPLMEPRADGGKTYGSR
jgi:hypothetical protein